MVRTEPGIRYHDWRTGRLFLNGRLIGYALPMSFRLDEAARNHRDEYFDNLKQAREEKK